MGMGDENIRQTPRADGCQEIAELQLIAWPGIEQTQGLISDQITVCSGAGHGSWIAAKNAEYRHFASMDCHGFACV